LKLGSAFERLASVLFGGLAASASDLSRTIQVARNVVLPGKTTEHEIDVFWRLQVANITYQTLIQAKDWTKPVDQGEVLKLKGVLDDLPTNLEVSWFRVSVSKKVHLPSHEETAYFSSLSRKYRPNLLPLKQHPNL